MKAAFATTDGIHVNEHFGRAGRFVVYEFSTEGGDPVGEIVFSEEGRDRVVESTKGMGGRHDSAVEDKIDRLEGCGLVYFTNIGGPSAARLTRRGIMPVKVEDGTDISESAEKLMETIRNSPPPWLRKLLG